MRTEEAPFWLKHWRDRARAAEAKLDAIQPDEMVEVVAGVISKKVEAAHEDEVATAKRILERYGKESFFFNKDRREGFHEGLSELHNHLQKARKGMAKAALKAIAETIDG